MLVLFTQSVDIQTPIMLRNAGQPVLSFPKRRTTQTRLLKIVIIINLKSRRTHQRQIRIGILLTALPVQRPSHRTSVRIRLGREYLLRVHGSKSIVNFRCIVNRCFLFVCGKDERDFVQGYSHENNADTRNVDCVQFVTERHNPSVRSVDGVCVVDPYTVDTVTRTMKGKKVSSVRGRRKDRICPSMPQKTHPTTIVINSFNTPPIMSTIAFDLSISQNSHSTIAMAMNAPINPNEMVLNAWFASSK